MSKQSIISQIAAEFDRLGVSYQTGGSADFVITNEFVDAGWSTGNKKISYEALVFADDSTETVFMYELTRESGKGVSFGSESDSYSQSGATLFRKVKGIKYGPEGKACEYTLDLGAIPKTVKEAAKQYGWKFKTVLRKEKASYPAGYVSAYTPSAQQNSPVQPQPRQFCGNCGTGLAEGDSFCPKCGLPAGTAANPRREDASPGQNAARGTDENRVVKTGKRAGILLSISCVLVLVFYSLMAVPWIGWLMTIAVLAAFFLLARKAAAGSLLRTILLWVGAMIVVFFIFIFSVPGKDSGTSGKVSSPPGAAVSSGGMASPASGKSSPDSAAAKANQQASMNDLFAHILKTVKQEWKPDAKISKIYTVKSSNDFHELKSFDPATNWNVAFYSPSSNTEINVILRYEFMDSEGFPGIGYFCRNGSGAEKEMRQEVLKQNPDFRIIETTPAAAYKEAYLKMPDNMLLGASLTAQQVGEKAYAFVKNKTNSSGSYGISIYYVKKMITNGEELNSAVWEISWSGSSKREHFVINPFSGKTYEY